MEYVHVPNTFVPADPEPCFNLLQYYINARDDTTALGLVDTFGRFYAERVPDITYDELTTCLDTYVTPALLPELTEQLPNRDVFNTVHNLGAAAVVLHQVPHPSLYKSVHNALPEKDPSNSSDYKSKDDFIHLSVMTDHFQAALEFVNTHTTSDRQGDLGKIAQVLAISGLPLAQKAEHAKILLEEFSILDTPQGWNDSSLRELFGMLYAHQPLQAVTTAEDNQQLTALLLGMLDNNHVPPAALRERVKPHTNNNIFLRQDILEAYVKAGDLSTAYQILTEETQMTNNLEYVPSIRLDMLASTLEAAIACAPEKLEDGSEIHDLLKTAAKSPVSFIEKMGPYALIEKALIKKGWPSAVEEFANLRTRKLSKTLDPSDQEKVILSHVYAGDLEKAESLAMRLDSDRQKAFTLQQIAEALYEYAPHDPLARNKVIHLHEMSYGYYKAAGYTDKVLCAGLDFIHQIIEHSHLDFAEQVQASMGPGYSSNVDKAALAIALRDGCYDHVAAMAEDYGSLQMMTRAVGESVRAGLRARKP